MFWESQAVQSGQVHAPRCEVLPLPGRQVSFRVDGREKTRWHFGSDAPRPFFYPIIGPAGETLTRMGHPGASNHDHHRSVWFAHNKLMGIDFWSEETSAFIRQKMWFEHRDGDDECGMAVQLDWHDGHDPQPLVSQELIVWLRPLDGEEWELDLQSTFRPLAEQIEFQQTNFGFLAVRVAKSLSGHFGGGTLTGESGVTGEKELFAQSNRWMDYSGPVVARDEQGRPRQQVNGITYFDHPHNPSYPTKWHVREDGWMGAAACLDAPLLTTRLKPLCLRYLLHIHDGAVDRERAAEVAANWVKRPRQTVSRSSKPHLQYEIQPLADTGE